VNSDVCYALRCLAGIWHRKAPYTASEGHIAALCASGSCHVLMGSTALEAEWAEQLHGMGQYSFSCCKWAVLRGLGWAPPSLLGDICATDRHIGRSNHCGWRVAALWLGDDPSVFTVSMHCSQQSFPAVEQRPDWDIGLPAGDHRRREYLQVSRQCPAAARPASACLPSAPSSSSPSSSKPGPGRGHCQRPQPFRHRCRACHSNPAPVPGLP